MSHATLRPVVVASLLAFSCGYEPRDVVAVADVHVDALSVAAPVTRTLVHGSLQLRADALSNDGTHRDVTTLARWGTSNAAIATVDAQGVATFHAPGQVRVGALYAGQETSLLLSTRSPVLERLAIEPAEEVLVALGEKVALQAWAVWEDGRRENVTTMVRWQADGALQFTAEPGLARATAQGPVTVQAALGEWSAQKSFAVTAPRVTEVLVAMMPAPLRPGATRQAYLVSKLSDGSVRNLNATAGWSSSDNTVANVTEAGLVVARALGTAVIHGRSGQLHGDLRVHVVDRALVGLESGSGTLTAPAGITTKIPLVAHFDDGTSRDVSEEASWATWDSAILELTWPGEFRGLREGGAMVMATYGGFDLSLNVRVTPAVVMTLTTTLRQPAMLTCGETVSFRVEGVYSDGVHADVTRVVEVDAPAGLLMADERAEGLTFKANDPGQYTLGLMLGRAYTQLTLDVGSPVQVPHHDP